MARPIPLAWRQLTFHRMKLISALAGVMVAVMLMWIQLGILASIYDSATVVHRSLNADLVLIHPHSDNLGKLKPLSLRTIYRFRGHPDVLEVGEMMVSPVDLRNPETGRQRSIMNYGVDPERNWLLLPGVSDSAALLRNKDTFLYDRNSRPVFGPLIELFQHGGPCDVELNRRTMRLVGMTECASSFGQEGCIVTTPVNFLRLHPEHPPGEAHAGLIRLRPGADLPALRDHFQREMPDEVLILSRSEFEAFELRFWKTNAPVGFIFTMGTVVGFFIGFIVVYQILHTDVTNHLPQYATMKAIGFTDNFLLRLVLKQALYLSALGYVPGSLLAIGFYQVMRAGTGIPIKPTLERGVFLLVLTILMCFLSGALATRKLRAADPADVF